VIVYCAYCGPLPLADLETLGGDAWEKHLRSNEHIKVSGAQWTEECQEFGCHEVDSVIGGGRT